MTLLKKLKMNREGAKNAKKIKIKIKNLCVLCPTGRLRSAFVVSLYLFSEESRMNLA